MQRIVPIIMGSEKDKAYASHIGDELAGIGILVDYRVASAHKTTKYLLDMLDDYELNLGEGDHLVYLTVAGRSNGLGGVVAGNTEFPVITAPPDGVSIDLPSSLRMPSDLPLMTAIDPAGAAEMVKRIFSLYGNPEFCQKPHVKITGNFGAFYERIEKKLRSLDISLSEHGEPHVLINTTVQSQGAIYPTITCYAEMQKHLEEGLVSPVHLDVNNLWHGKCLVMEPENAALAAVAIAAGANPGVEETWSNYRHGVIRKAIDVDINIRGQQ
jgi:phosphoribosylaminoimidazole carboxylase PurE protein